MALIMRRETQELARPKSAEQNTSKSSQIFSVQRPRLGTAAGTFHEALDRLHPNSIATCANLLYDAPSQARHRNIRPKMFEPSPPQTISLPVAFH